MSKKRMNFESITDVAAEVAANAGAQKFVSAAGKTVDSSPPVDNSASQDMDSFAQKSEPMLMVEGYLKNRKETCGDPIQLYLLKDLEEWMLLHGKAGRGGNQILINYLIRRGIESIEAEYSKTGVIFAKEGP